MLRIGLETRPDRVHFPGSVIRGSVKAARGGYVEDIRLQFVAILKFETQRGGYSGHAWVCKEIRFINEEAVLLEARRKVSADDEWPFEFKLPAEVDWYQADRDWPDTLGVEDISLIPTELPPSVGKSKTASLFDISYQLIMHEQSGTPTDDKTTKVKITVCPTRPETRPSPQFKAQIEQFICQSHQFSAGGERRNFKSLVSGGFKLAPTYKFDVVFGLPQICIIGENLQIQAELRSNGLISTGSPAPPVILTGLHTVVRSHTRLDNGRELEPTRGRVADPYSRTSVFDRVVGTFTMKHPLELKRREQCPISYDGTRFAVSEGLSPSFQTLGLGRSYTLEIAGEIRVQDVTQGFTLRRQYVKMLPAWSREHHRILDAGPSELSPSVPPPAYEEAMAEADECISMRLVGSSTW